MEINRFLKLAVVLWSIAVLGASALPGAAAKYVAQATGGSTVQVAKWDAFDRIDPTDEDNDGSSVVLVFEPEAVSGESELTLVNESEVPARYVLELKVGNVDTMDETLFLSAIESSITPIGPYSYSSSAGIEVPCGETRKLKITIPAVTFQRLQIDACAVQVD